MRLLVTGGRGFVMSGTVRHLLETDPAASALLVDIGEVDGLVDDFFEPVRTRITHVRGDVRDRDFLASLVLEYVTHVIHAAALTHLQEGEARDPGRFVEVNVLG